MKSRFLCAFIAAVLCPLLSATTTVTGNIKTLGATVANKSFVRFWLRGCRGNQPRVSGVAIFPANVNGQFYFDIPTDASGTVSGTLYSTRAANGIDSGEIECGGSRVAVYYGMQVFRNSVGGPEVPVHAKDTAILDVSTVTPITASSVVAAPTGDTTYARLDGGNQPFLGGIQAASVTTSGAVTSGSVSTGAISGTAGTLTSLNNTIYATAGETVAHAVARLPVGGGKVIFGVGTYPSGGVTISTPNIWLEGSGMPTYNSATAPTALTGGTIFQGPINVTQGADHFVIRNAGVDAGPNWVNGSNGGTATDAFSIANNGQVIGAPQVQAPIIENVSCLGFSTSAAFHCMLVENVTNAYVHNVQTVYNQHGLVLKGTFSTVDGVYARGHSIDAVIVKSDNYAISAVDTLTNIRIFPLATAGDTKGMILQAVGAGMNDITVSNTDIYQALSFGIQVQGTSVSNAATNLNFSNIYINYGGGSPTSHYCFQYVQYVSAVHFNNLFCENYSNGIAPNSPVLGFTNDFSLTNSHFINISNNGVETNGRWAISNSGFIGITGTAITADASSTVNAINNQFASNGTDRGGAGTFDNVTIANGTNPVFRCLTAGTLPQGALTTNSTLCGTTVDVGLRVK